MLACVEGGSIWHLEAQARKCSPLEREWRGLCVDKNLDAEWFEQLNNLRLFDMISVCEGHFSNDDSCSGTPPHIKLSLKEQYLPHIVSQWDRHKMVVIEGVSTLFQTGQTYVNLELKCRLRYTMGILRYQEDLMVRVHGRRARSSVGMDAATRRSFTRIVASAVELDRAMAQVWDEIPVRFATAERTVVFTMFIPSHHQTLTLFSMVCVILASIHTGPPVPAIHASCTDEADGKGVLPAL